MNLHHSQINYSKWITDLNVKCETVKLLEDNITEHLDGLGFGNDFLDRPLMAGSVKVRIDKLQFITIKRYCQEHENTSHT